MFKNLNQLKKNVSTGQSVKVINHLKNVSEDRMVIKVKTVGLVTGREISKEEYQEKRQSFITENSVKEIDGKYFTYTHLDFQKAKHTEFDGNTVKFISHDEERYGGSVRMPSPEFEVGQPWLELIFK